MWKIHLKMCMDRWDNGDYQRNADATKIAANQDEEFF